MTEAKIREAAAALYGALSDGKKNGVVVQWPATPEGLTTLAISETAKAPAAAEAKKQAPKA